MIDWPSMPKVELHVHLEGAIPLPAMWELVQRHGGAADLPTPEALRQRFAYRDFTHFISTWEWKLAFHSTPDDYRFLAAAVAEDLRRQGHRYVEAFVSPSDSGLDTVEMLRAVRAGLDTVPGVEVMLVPDLVRDTGPQRSMGTLTDVIRCKDEVGVIGITIGGSEQDHPPGPFASVFEAARGAGLRLSAHAGEAAGPESVWAAIDHLEVDRVGHGVRAVEDPALVAELVARRIPLEVCPTSNVRTGVAAPGVAHPVHDLIGAGAFVTINTDDPAMFDCSLAGEFDLLGRDGVPLQTLRRLTENAIDGSWAPRSTRRDLRDRLDRWWRSQPVPPVA